MKERPIIFNGSNVRAILADRKTHTRRLMFKKYPCENIEYKGDLQFSASGVTWTEKEKYKVGDRFWVKETFGIFSVVGNEIGIGYRADHPQGGDLSKTDGGYNWRSVESCDLAHKIALKVDSDRWKPSLFMPRWASRITLEITAVRVERLNEISKADAIAEGIGKCGASGWLNYQNCKCKQQCDCEQLDCIDANQSFWSLWESIHGPGTFDARWVWVLEFKRV